MLRIATWNLERRKPASQKSRLATDHIRSLQPDLLVVTEGWVNHLGDHFHQIDAGPTNLPNLEEDERKVILASVWPLQPVDTELNVATPGRFVSAIVDTPEGEVRLIGVCIPWFASRVRSGGSGNWEDHRTFLEAIRPVMREASASPCIVAGDFNQRIPRCNQPHDVAELLADVFDPFDILTTGVRPGTGRQLIDHIAVSHHFQCQKVVDWAGEIQGTKVSDHDGVMVEVGLVHEKHAANRS